MSGASKGLFLGLGLLAVAASGCDEGMETVGPEGGVVTSPDGRITLDIPAGALDDDVVITIGEVDEGPDGTIGPVFEIEPRFLSLNIPAALTVDLGSSPDDAELTKRSAEVLESAAISTEAAYGWTHLADHTVDMEAATVTASVMYFSSYALVAE